VAKGNMHRILLHYVHKLDVQGINIKWRAWLYRPGRRRPQQTYSTAAFGEERVREGAHEQSQRASCEPLTAVADREDSILRLSRHPAP